MLLPYISFNTAFTALECIKRNLDSQSDLPPQHPHPPCGSNWGHNIAGFVFLPYISFITAFTALECMKRFWETICGESI